MPPASTRFAADSSVIIAAVCGWHARHAASLAAIEERIGTGGTLVVALHSLFECYAVLTRLPGPRRLAPPVAFELLRDNLRGRARVVGLTAAGAWALLGDLVPVGIAGGRTYDAMIARAVRKGGAEEILTLNPAHFDGLEGGKLRIVEPR